ncbi:MAG: hypothetical protein ACKVP4_03425 [Hyphomicrobium sp.]
MINLWSDISSLNAEEFVAAIDGITGTKQKVKKPSKKKPLPPADDKPVTRIAHQLRTKLGLSDVQAFSQLQQALVKNGVSQDHIPACATKSLEDWLYELLGHVPDSKVLAIAKKIRPNELDKS